LIPSVLEKVYEAENAAEIIADVGFFETAGAVPLGSVRSPKDSPFSLRCSHSHDHHQMGRNL
jgi:hypothetical protein